MTIFALSKSSYAQPPIEQPPANYPPAAPAQNDNESKNPPTQS